MGQMLEMSRQDLQKKNTRNLLYILKKARKLMYSAQNSYRCDCCGEPLFELYPNSYDKESIEADIKVKTNFYNMVKDVLKDKEHVRK